MSPEQGRHSTRHHHSSRRRHNPYSRRRLAPPSPFESFRIAVYAFALLWSLVALAIAVHFEGVFQASDLTKFIPYALFTSAASMLATVGLGALVIFFKSGPFVVKVESATSGLIGVFWFGLSVLTSTSPAEDAEVECFFDADDTELNTGSSFTTDIFHAQYRVLVAAGCINALLLLGVCVTLVYLSLRYYRKTKDWVEYTGQPLLNKSSKDREKSRSSSRSTAPLTAMPPRAAKRETTTREKIKALPLPAIAKRSKSEQQKPRQEVPKPISGSKPKSTPAPPQTKPAAKSSQQTPNTRTKPTATTSKTTNKTTIPPPKATQTRIRETPATRTPLPKRQNTTAPIHSKFSQ